MYKEITCPYCEHDYDLCHDDGAFYNDGEKEKEECPECGKIFMVTSSMSWSFEAEKAACQNGEEHDWQPKSGFPKECFIGRFTCSQCGEEDRRDEKGRAEAIKKYLDRR